MRIRRTERRPARIQVTTRDDFLMRNLADFRAARTSDLFTLAFPNRCRDTGAVRLRKLFNAGYLAVESEGLNAENIYTLDRLGRTYIQTHYGITVEQRRGRGKHHLALVHVWVSILRHCADSGVELTRFVPDWQMRNKGHRLIPDAVMQVGDRVFALEVDLGTEPLGTLKRKFRLYREAMARGTLPHTTHLLVAYQNRGDKLAQLVEHAWPSTYDLLTIPVQPSHLALAAGMPAVGTPSRATCPPIPLPEAGTDSGEREASERRA